MKPYYEDEAVTLYHGDWREIIPADFTADLILTDPPYGETSLEWDHWPHGWPAVAARHARSMWCFGSMRMFFDHRDDFGAWKLSQDIVWDKGRGTGPVSDRFRRIHEFATFWYQGTWGNVYHATPRVAWYGERRHATKERGSVVAAHRAEMAKRPLEWIDDGTRIQESIIRAANLHRQGGINETEKPVGLLEPLITYGCPPGGTVLDPFAGSGSTLIAARHQGRKAVGYELREGQCERTAKRLAQGVLPIGDAS